MAVRQRRVALDHNFPRSILDMLQVHLPEVELTPVARLAPELAELEDHDLIYELARRRWTILATGNYKMLNDAAVLVALHQTRLTLFSIEDAGDDPVLATGAMLRDLLPTIRKLSRRGQVFRSKPRAPKPERAYHLLEALAARQNRELDDVLAEHRRSWRDRGPDSY